MRLISRNAVRRSARNRAFSDHRLVSLELLIQPRRPDGAPLPVRRRVRRKGFDTKQWRKFASYFTPDDSPMLRGLQEVAQGLSTKSLNSTQAVDRISDVLGGAMKRAFGIGQAVNMPRAGHVPWWNEDCARTHAAMSVKLAAARGQGRASDAWRDFRYSRLVYNRARRHAMASFEEKEWREFIHSCREDPKALWEKLSGGATGCLVPHHEHRGMAQPLSGTAE